MASALWGAQTAQFKTLEGKTQRALEKAEEALKEAQGVKALEEKAKQVEETAVKASKEAQEAKGAV